MQKTRYPVQTVVIYTLTGLCYVLLGMLATFPLHPGDFWQLLVNHAWSVLYAAALQWLLWDQALGWALRKRKIRYRMVSLSVLLVSLCVCFSWVSLWWRTLGMYAHVYVPLRAYPSVRIAIENQLGYHFGATILFGIVIQTAGYFLLREQARNLTLQKAQAELRYLKNQTNPHFLFNTLNNIYVLAKEKSDLAETSILRLSEIMRFLLYESGTGMVTLEKEIRLIDDYLELERLRYPAFVKIELARDIDNPMEQIAPMLILPLVENAFKHGYLNDNHLAQVQVKIGLVKKRLTVTVRNPVAGFEANRSGGIGLSNLRRQLQLQYGVFDLQTERSADSFTAILQLDLGTHA